MFKSRVPQIRKSALDYAASKLNRDENRLDDKGPVKDLEIKRGLADEVIGKPPESTLPQNNTSFGSANNGNKNTGFNYGPFTYDDYAASDTEAQAWEKYSLLLGAKPSGQQSTWKSQVDSIIDKILNREDFSYDFNRDALYQQYKDQYTQLGKLAMADTMGQAAALTGGYGSSYATTAGNQAYQAYLSQLNEVMPELYAMARDQHQQEGEELYNEYALLSAQDDKEYSRYQDALNNWFNETQLAYDIANNERNFGYNQHINDRDFAYGVYSDNKAMSYNEYRNAIADAQWQKQFDAQQKQWEKEFALQQDKWNTEKGAYKASQATGSSEDEDGGSTVNGTTDIVIDGTNKLSGVSDNIRKKLDSFESNIAAESYLESLEASGAIDHETALQLMSEYMDVNEVYKENKDKGKYASYSDMAKSTSGWSVVDNGGTNWFWGVDNNAIVKAPNGEQIRLDNLVDKLVSEGMSKSDAKSYVKQLQKNLKI